MSKKPISRNTNIVVQKLENEVLIYDLTDNKAFCLNQTTSLVFEYADGTRTATEISESMSKVMRTSVSEDIVWLALNELDKHGLLETSSGARNHFPGLSRREIIRRVGLLSLVALPIVTSIVAPSVAAAASCLTFSSPCILGSACCPGSLCANTPGGAICTCSCNNPGDCSVQTGCPNTNNCNASNVCAP